MYNNLNVMKEENTCTSILKIIDLFSFPINWYIGGNKKHGTLLGGVRTIGIIATSVAMLIYSAYVMFSHKKGSFIYYDMTHLDSGERNITYFDDFELFIIPVSQYSTMRLDANIAGLFLQEVEKMNVEDVTLVNGTADYKPVLFSPKRILKSLKFGLCDTAYFKTKINMDLPNMEPYCLSSSEMKTSGENLTFTLTSKIITGEFSTHPILRLMPICGKNCTDQELSRFKLYVSSIQYLITFVVQKKAAPYNLEQPEEFHASLYSFYLTSKNLFEIYLKLYTIETDASIWPYSSSDIETFYTLDHFATDNIEASVYNSVDIGIYLSETFSYIERKYDKIDTLLGNLIGVFNFQAAICQIFTFVLSQYDKDIYIFNSIFRHCMYEFKDDLKSNQHFIEIPKIRIEKNNNSQSKIINNESVSIYKKYE